MCFIQHNLTAKTITLFLEKEPNVSAELRRLRFTSLFISEFTVYVSALGLSAEF